MWLYFAASILLLAGGGILLFVVKNVIETVVFLRAATRTEGKVVRYATTRNSDGRTMYLPVFQYRSKDGNFYEHTGSVASQPPAYALGETATLLHLRKSPQKARLNKFSELWLLSLILAIVGAILCMGAVQIFLHLR